jgi:hypothetical protein
MAPQLCANCGHAVDVEVLVSPVPELLRSDIILSASQERIVRATISAAQSHISQIDDEIARLQKSLENLEHKRDALLAYSKAHIPLVAPVRRLPPEILSEIFIHCVGTNCFDSFTQFSLPRLDNTPLLLGSICSKWRSISLSTPRLWASFSLTIWPRYLKHDIPLAKTWLARAGACPLSIQLSSRGGDQNSMDQLMQVFLLHCEYWYDVWLSLSPAVMSQLSPAKNRLRRLQKLRIDGYGHETIDIFECAPQLSYFCPPMSIVPSSAKFPWNQLRYIDTGSSNCDECVEMLRLTPNLEGCAIWPIDLLLQNLPPQVELPRLRSIIIHGNGPDLLHKLLVPELQKVSVNLPRTGLWIATQQLVSFFSRCSIRILSLKSWSHPTPSDNDMIQILQASPDLVELDLRGYTAKVMTKSFLTQFAHRQGSIDSSALHLVPMLRTIRVDYKPSYFDLPAFADAIRSRRVFEVEIRDVSVGAGHIRPEDMSRLRQLQEMGIVINIVKELL